MRRWLSKLTFMNNSYSIPIGPFTISPNLAIRINAYACIHKRLYYYMTSKKLRVSLSVGSLRIEIIHKTREGQLVGPRECAKKLRMLPLKRGRSGLETSIR